jgi:cell division septation protein DedD
MTNARILTAFAAGLMLIGLMPTAQADEWNKKTTITIDQPVQLPTMVLQPGTYVMKLLDSKSDRHVVQVFDKDEKRLITTIMAIPNTRLQPTGKSEFDFWEVPAGQPKALRAWFYPGDNFGQEFAYPKNLATRIEANTNATVPTLNNEETASNAGSAPVENQNNNSDTNSGALQTRTEVPTPPPPPVRTPAPVAAQPERTPAPEPTQVAQNNPPPAPEPAATPSELPQTASSLPLVGLVGLLSLAALGLTIRARLPRQ